jgi:NADH-quinone oxidoreductase subunit J
LNWEAVFFWMLAVVTLVPAISILFEPGIVRMAFWLLGTLSGVAGLYLLLGADFLGLTQVMVYIGGINVLLLFGIMLTTKEPVFLRKRPTAIPRIPALAMGLVVLAALVVCIMKTQWRVQPEADLQPTTKAIGTFLMSDYILPFEMISILLLVVLVGAAYLARRLPAAEARS